MFKEFKAFIAQGNVLDLAVGVIIGAAFGKITTSLVDDIIMPVVGLITNGGINTKGGIILKAAEGSTPAIVLNYGNFLGVIINFLIIAYVVFLIVKAANAMGLSEKKAE
ncbi:large conductance mechanosensitive channel [Pseudarcicella hirudinis]|uniref:Large-conductance mechanosensitive channel n=1 Tax=Pseudarcicella hirudinis TaxID=1079859 RepID=A0A1I5UGW8_9BACT|nr:large conductance mechanosensitive channel protein MscL [Pseudarcicella hirudinis]SFP94439.1 large conductance mechanosensitive channel [Pseudarcicella hirudinis]